MSHEVDINDLDELKKLQAEAVKSSKDIYWFKGSQILVSYGKYLIEHLENMKGNLK